MKSALGALQRGLRFSVIKKSRKDGGGNFSSLALSESGKRFIGSTFHSDTNLLDIPSEQAALMRSTHVGDYEVTEVITLSESGSAVVSPLILKIIADHSYRTGKKISYKIVNKKGDILYKTQDVRKSLSFYKPARLILPRPVTKEVGGHVSVKNAQNNTPKLLKEYATKGVLNNFPTYPSASGYGAALLTTTGILYFGGQYSSPEKRSGLHAEMAVVINALMDGVTDIKALGVVSTKHRDKPCEICGCCRQFLSEIFAKKDMKKVAIYCFAKDTKEVRRYTIDNLLPNLWDSKKW